MNKWIGIGNLTRDPESRVTSTGKSVCNFTVAVSRKFGEKKEVDYIPVITWQELANNCAKFLRKGSKVGVSGRIQVRNYDASDGTKRYVTEIIADEVEFLSPKTEGSGTPNQFEVDRQEKFGDFEPVDDELLPF